MPVSFKIKIKPTEHVRSSVITEILRATTLQCRILPDMDSERFKMANMTIKVIHDDTVRQTMDNSAIPPSYVRVRAVVWACSEGQTADGRDHYTFRVIYDSHEM